MLYFKDEFDRSGSCWTGVFIAIDYALDRLTRQTTIDMLGLTNALRLQRSHMIQVLIYIYIYIYCWN